MLCLHRDLNRTPHSLTRAPPLQMLTRWHRSRDMQSIPCKRFVCLFRFCFLGARRDGFEMDGPDGYGAEAGARARRNEKGRERRQGEMPRPYGHLLKNQKADERAPGTGHLMDNEQACMSSRQLGTRLCWQTSPTRPGIRVYSWT